jgi:hypothetical protein
MEFPFAGLPVVAGDSALDHFVAEAVARNEEGDAVAAAKAKRAERRHDDELQQLTHRSSSGATPTPAADVYSLGQLLFYMLSGGRRAAPGNIFDTRHAELFAKGPRHELLRLLLSKMIAPIETRYGDMARVLAELEQNENWEQSARAGGDRQIAEEHGRGNGTSSDLCSDKRRRDR